MSINRVSFFDFLIYGINNLYLKSTISIEKLEREMEKVNFKSQYLDIFLQGMLYIEYIQILKGTHALKAFCKFHEITITKNVNEYPKIDRNNKKSINMMPVGLIPIDGRKIIGRDKEVELISIILRKKYRSNILIVGDPGVGKTALVAELSKKYPILQLDIVSLISDTEYRGSFERKLRKIISYSIEQGVILFIDEIHALYNLGRTEGGVSALDILKPYLSSGEISIIGATTYNEMKILGEDRAFTRRFVYLKLPHITLDYIMKNITKFTSDYDSTLDKSLTLLLLEKISNLYSENKVLDVFLDAYDTIVSASKNTNEVMTKQKFLDEYEWIFEELYDREL